MESRIDRKAAHEFEFILRTTATIMPGIHQNDCVSDHREIPKAYSMPFSPTEEVLY
jgi:hypothetical protein